MRAHSHAHPSAHSNALMRLAAALGQGTALTRRDALFAFRSVAIGILDFSNE
jgi:hypothetical protein